VGADGSTALCTVSIRRVHGEARSSASPLFTTRDPIQSHPSACWSSPRPNSSHRGSRQTRHRKQQISPRQRRAAGRSQIAVTHCLAAEFHDLLVVWSADAAKSRDSALVPEKFARLDSTSLRHHSLEKRCNESINALLSSKRT
jgi:hypothetical protein